MIDAASRGTRKSKSQATKYAWSSKLVRNLRTAPAEKILGADSRHLLHRNKKFSELPSRTEGGRRA